MTRLPTLLLVLLLASTLSACLPKLKSYADPTYRKATVQQLTPLKPPLPVRVEVQFQQQGKPKASSDLRLRAHVEKALRSSGVLVPEQRAASVLRVVVNNVGDTGAGYIAGIQNRLSLGFSGAIVTDEYHFNISYTSVDGGKQDVFFRHALHTAVGGIDLPVEVAPLRPSQAFGQVVEDAVLATLLQLQSEQRLRR